MTDNVEEGLEQARCGAPRSLLSTAIDEADPGPGTITGILDAIPGALERHEKGRAEAREGRAIPLEDL